MRIALVWPRGYDIKYVMPLSLGYLKSNLEGHGHDVKLFDCALKDVPADSQKFRDSLEYYKPDIVGTSSWSPTYRESIKILQVAKSINPKIVTVLGGAHASSYPDAPMKDEAVDYVFRGESELAFPKFIKQIEAGTNDFSEVGGLVYRKDGKLVKNPMEREREIDKIRIPDYDAMELDEYIKKGYRFNTPHKYNAPVWITRGCPYRCGFCSAPLQNGKIIRHHSVEYMINWVKYLYHEKGIRQINIIDDNFTFHMKLAKDFCRALIDLNLPGLTFGTPNGIRIQRTDAELLNLMKQAGWENLIVAPESGSAKTLKRMRKDLDPTLIPQKVKEIKAAGLKVHGFFIVGYPGETPEDLKLTRKLLRDCGFNFFFLNNFQPLPGTPIYDELVAEGEIVDGLLPKNYSSGERAYTPEYLQDFNFPKYVLNEYIHLALSNPINIPYMVKLVNPKMMVTKVFSNVRNMVSGNGQKEKLAPEVMLMQE
jgi:anaerobic magnesium-protoporphyrin IX monomethyl ester cyclase